MLQSFWSSASGFYTTTLILILVAYREFQLSLPFFCVASGLILFALSTRRLIKRMIGE